MTRANRTGKPKGSPRQKKSKSSSGQPYQFIVGLVDVLEEEVTENDQIDKPLNEKHCQSSRQHWSFWLE